MNARSIICGAAAVFALACALHAADRSGELSEGERNGLVLGSTQGPALAPLGTRSDQKSLAEFDLERLRAASISELIRIVLPLMEGQQIDSALAVIESLPVETSVQVLAVVLSPARLASLSSLETDAVVQMLITHEALLVALAQTSPESIASLLVHANNETTTAFLAALADITIRSDFDAERLFSVLSIKRLSPGFTDLNPESHFGVRLRELKAEAKAHGETPELKARITALYREALQAISTKNGSPDER